MSRPMEARTLVEHLVNTEGVREWLLAGRVSRAIAGLAKKCNAAAAAHEQPNVEIILTRVLRPMPSCETLPGNLVWLRYKVKR